MLKAKVKIQERLARFLRKHAGPSYDGFTPDVLEEYLQFHAAQRTLSWNHEGGRLRAVGVAWQCQLDEVLAADEAGANPFRWRPDNAGGDCLFIGNVTALSALALAGLLAGLLARWPHWRSLRLMSYRKGRLTELKHESLLRLMRRSCL